MEYLITYITIFLISLIYLLIGFGINKENAQYLLSGYNTMSDKKKENFDIESYLIFFKSFFKKLSIFPLATYILCSFFMEGDTLIWAWAILQLAPYVLFAFRSFRF